MTSISNNSWHEEAGKQARTLQIIVATLVMGCVIFLLIALAVGPVVNPPNPLQPISLTMIACGLVGIELIAQVVVAWSIITKARRGIVNGTHNSVDPRQGNGQSFEVTYLLSIVQTKTIISGALFEGMAFFATIAYLIEGNPISLGLAVLMIVCVAAQFPTRSRIVSWVERQIGAIEQEKMLRFQDGE
ncbi:MAG: hypothetical protein ACLP9L_30515 [Thermoguttaceae bacterium]